MSDADIYHHGVKGMKWGVRKDQYRSYQDDATQDEGKGLRRVQAAVNMTRYFATGAKVRSKIKMDEDWYNKLDTGKQYIEKGDIMKRVVRGVDAKATSGYLYVSRLESDSLMYRATIPAVQTKGKYAKKTYHTVYQVELEAKKRMSMPSKKERVDTFIEQLQTPGGKQWLKDNGYKNEVDEYNAKKVGLDYYARFNKYAGNQNVPFNSQYFNSIKSKGYGAMIDDNDAGIWSKEPTILLSPKQTIKVKDVRQLSATEINDAQRDVLKFRQYRR